MPRQAIYKHHHGNICTILNDILFFCIFCTPSLRSYASPSLHPKYHTIRIISISATCLIRCRQRACLDGCSFSSKCILRTRAQDREELQQGILDILHNLSLVLPTIRG